MGAMELFAVSGTAPYELPKPTGLGAGRSEGRDHVVIVEAEQFPYCHGGRKCADGCGGVEDAVVRPAERLGDADSCFVPGNAGQEQLFSRLVVVLCSCQRGREDDPMVASANASSPQTLPTQRWKGLLGLRCGMHHTAIVQVVLLEGVAGSRIHPGSPVGAGRRRRGDEL